MDDDFEGGYSDSTIEENNDGIETSQNDTGDEIDFGEVVQLDPQINDVQLEPEINEVDQLEHVINELVQLDPQINEMDQLEHVINELVQLDPQINEVVQQEPQINEVVQQEPQINEVVQLQPQINEVVQLEPQINEVVQLRPQLNVVQPQMNDEANLNPHEINYINNEVNVRNERPAEDLDCQILCSKTKVPLSSCRNAKRSRTSDSDDEDTDSRNVCPICMDNWTNAGDHRLVCLKCGHLFGKSCIERWLDVACSAGQRRCPQCNVSAKKRDIRKLFVHNLKVLDTSETEKLKQEIETIKKDKRQVEMDLAKANLQSSFHYAELQQALNKIKTLESKLLSHSQLNQSQPSSQLSPITRLSLENTLEISSAGGCRVMTCNTSMRELYVSHSSTNALFPGFSMRKIDMQDYRPNFGQCVYLHTKAIRDLAVRPQSNDLLLSVSLDKSAKLLDLSNNCVVNKFVANSSLWSCCWDRTNLNRFFVGSQNGSVTQYDSRQPNTPLQQLSFPNDLSPVTSLASLSYCAGRAMPQGGLLVSKLVSCWAYTQDITGAQYEGQQLALEGPFTSLCYDKDTNHVLVSRRPNARNPNICHMVCQLDQQGTTVTCNVVHNFTGGTAQMQLSRPCFAKGSNDIYVSAYVESRSNLSVWSVTSGQAVASVKAYDPVKDICPLHLGDRLWFAALSEKTLRFYCMS